MNYFGKQTPWDIATYVNSLCGQGLDNVPLSHGQTWTIGRPPNHLVYVVIE